MGASLPTLDIQHSTGRGKEIETHGYDTRKDIRAKPGTNQGTVRFPLSLASEAVERLVEHPGFAQPMDRELLGINDLPFLRRFNPELTTEEKNALRSGVKVTRPREEKVRDYDIDGLAEALALAEHTADAAVATRIGRIIWNVLLKLRLQHEDSDFWQGRYDWFNLRPRESTFDSTFLRRLKQASWIPDRQGVLHRPADIDVSEMADGFELHDEMIAKLGIKNAHDERRQEFVEKQEQAARLGVELSDIELIRKNWDAFVRFRDELVAAQCVAPAFPERAPTNPARREARIQESREDAPPKAYETRERSVRVSAPPTDPKLWLRNQYTNDDGQMVCQMCEREMPFKMPNGEYYFEAVEITRRMAFEHRGMRIALCPVCAAKYKVFIHGDDKAQRDAEAALVATTTRMLKSPRISIPLANETGSLRFVDTHLLDVRTLLKPQE